ncbi:MAG TPA: BrnT family toxin [Thermoanaerobaculia bacterium]|nr:BrnT family toxin [Thermoanaerobaculia bacterium]
MNSRFEWNVEKARANTQKHGVRFEEAETVFDDPLARIGDDPDHSAQERRELIFGQSSAGRFLLISFTQRDNTVRIISARRADKDERKRYEEDIIL